jgi:hypothetical protein
MMKARAPQFIDSLLNVATRIHSPVRILTTLLVPTRGELENRDCLNVSVKVLSTVFETSRLS